MFLGVCLERMSGEQMEWDPSLQAPELTEQSGFIRCFSRAQAIFIWPLSFLFLPVLSKFSCRNGAIGFPKISSCRSQVGWQLCCAFRTSKCCKSPPWLVWIGQMLSHEVLLGSEASWNHILVTLELECWVWASALAAEQAGGGCRRSKRS